MQKYIVSALLLVAFISLIALVVRVWLARRSHQEAVIAEPLLPFSGSSVAFEGSYVATTVAGEPLNRIMAHGLAHRGKASIEISNEGVSLLRQGERSFGIAKADIHSVSLERGTIDRAVENEGLVAIVWQSGPSQLETSLRIVDRTERIALFTALENLVSKENH